MAQSEPPSSADPASNPQTSASSNAIDRKWLFWACFVALTATAFGFIIRVQIIGEWGVQFRLTETQKGEILGAGLWPFAISIVIFSLVIDKVGYGKAMVFAFVCHSLSAVITVFANGYWSLYIGTFLVALGNGTVEAVINPVVATMFSRQKTKWLSILHAGWPGGLVLGGLLTLSLNPTGIVGRFADGPISWHWKVVLILIPTALYGLMMLRCKFPVQERVSAGVPYRVMLREAGVIGCLIATALIVWEVTRVFMESGHLFVDFSALQVRWARIGLTILLSIPFALYTRSLGRTLFSLLLVLMILAAITEVSTDSWIKDLMAPQVNKLWGLNLDGAWMLVYSAAIMMTLRFFAGPLVNRFNPVGVLALSSAVAVVGLVFLSNAGGSTLFMAATIYGVGQTFFWPCMLGVASEQFPRGGAMTINTIAAVGVLGVGVLGNPWFGYLQDTRVEADLAADHPAVHQIVIGDERDSVFGRSRGLDQKVINAINDKVALYEARGAADESSHDPQKLHRLVTDIYNRHVRKKGDYQAYETDDMVEALDQAGMIISNDGYERLAAHRNIVGASTRKAKKTTLTTVAVLPAIMVVCYSGLLIYFRARGGYRPVHLTEEPS